MSATTLHGTAAPDAPFPGLRAFEAEESLLFYGREAHVAELLDRLGDSRFVAVTGTSGSGKSSLVRAGLRPALHRGYLVDATSRWRFATMRPGSAPIEALAHALAEALGSEPVEQIARSLRATSAGLSEVVARAGLPRGESLLVIADQFEELFRFDVTRDQQADAALFVSLLLEAAEQRTAPVYLVVTMRSEFLGRCSEFTGLAEAFNRSQYLVPRLTRDERREAIERPLKLFGTAPTPALVQQVLNDAGDDPDQLPVLQHVLLRTYREWARAGGIGRLDRQHYEAVGGIERALDRHGDEILAGLGERAQRMATTVFRTLTVAQGGVALRRPRRMRELYAIAGAADADARRDIDGVVRTFVQRDNSFLTLSSPNLAPETVVDITHESLIRKWTRLDAWMRDETRSAEWYADLSRDVLRYRSGEVSLWQDPELAGAQRRRQDERWNAAWADQYRRDFDPSFDEVLSFLDESAKRQTERQRQEEERRDRELRQAQALVRAKRREMAVMALFLIAAGFTALLLYRDVRRNEADRSAAEAQLEYLNQIQASNAKLAEYEARLEELKQATGTATPEERARLQQLTQEIETARAQSRASEDELGKLRKEQALSASDRGVFITRIETLQQQLAQMTTERDRLQAEAARAQRTSQASQPVPQDERVQALQRQLEEEQRRSAAAAGEIDKLETEVAELRAAVPPTQPIPPPPLRASAQELAKAYTDGVKAYELRDWRASAQSMLGAIALQGSVTQVPKEVRTDGTQFVPYTPWSYVAALMFELKDCAAVRSALLAAQRAGEPAAPRIGGRLAEARTQCSR